MWQKLILLILLITLERPTAQAAQLSAETFEVAAAFGQAKRDLMSRFISS
jgi:hypothetical protein